MTLRFADKADLVNGKIPAAQLVPTAGNAALAILFGGLATRTSSPCRLAFVGSSTTAGVNATAPVNRYVNQLVAAFQQLYPSGLGTETTVVDSTSADFGTLTTALGVHGYNAGEGGTTAATYLTSSEITKVAALNPRAVFHMVGSNDFANGVDPVAYKASLLSVVNSLKSSIAGPCVQVLVQPYERYDSTTHPYPWASYGQAMAEVAAANPFLFYLDLSAGYAALGVPGADPLGLMTADKIHQNNYGHAYMADSILRGLGLSAPAATVTAVAAAPTGQSVTLTRLASDSFAGANAATVVGRTSDSALGGNGRQWVGDGTNAYAISGQKLTRGANVVSFAGLPVGTFNAEVSLTILAPESSGNPDNALFVDLHRQSPNIGGTPDAYRLYISGNMTLLLRRRIGGSLSPLTDATAPYALGDRLALRCTRANGTNTLEVRCNGTLVLSATDNNITTAGYAGLANTAVAAGFAVDDFALDAVN